MLTSLFKPASLMHGNYKSNASSGSLNHIMYMAVYHSFHIREREASVEYSSIQPWHLCGQILNRDVLSDLQ